MTPRSQLGNHPNPMVREYGLAEPDAVCLTCSLRQPMSHGAWRHVCTLRSSNSPVHLPSWDACALHKPKMS